MLGQRQIRNSDAYLMTRKTPYNSTYKKLAVQWLNDTLCFVSSSVVADSFRLRNRQLLKPTKRYYHTNGQI